MTEHSRRLKKISIWGFRWKPATREDEWIMSNTSWLCRSIYFGPLEFWYSPGGGFYDFVWNNILGLVLLGSSVGTFYYQSAACLVLWILSTLLLVVVGMS